MTEPAPSKSESDQSKPRLSRKKRLIFGVASVLMILGLGLGGLEIYARYRLPDFSPKHMNLKSRLTYTNSSFSRHTFATVEQRVVSDDGDEDLVYRINRLGFRGEEFEPIKPEGVFRVMIMGGSAVFDPQAAPGKDWPRLVHQDLRARGYANVECINGGIPGLSASDVLGRLTSEIHMFKPDVVIFYNIWNDAKMLRALSNGFTMQQAVPPFNPELDPRLFVQGFWDALLCRSQLYCFLRLRYLEWKLAIGPEGAAFGTQKGIDDFPPLFPARSRDNRSHYMGPLRDQYRYNFMNLVDCARNAGITPIIAAPATLVHADNSQKDQDRIRVRYIGGSHSGLVTLFNSMLAILARVAEEKKCLFLDLNAEFSGQSELFGDAIHLSPEGSIAVARATADFLEEHFQDRMRGPSAP